MNFIRIDNSTTFNKNENYKNSNFENSNENQSSTLNFIYNSNKKLFKKNLFKENENNSEISLSSEKKDAKEISFKLSSFSQQKQKVIFSNGIEEIYEDSKNNAEDEFFYNISNKKYSTPPRNTKSSYKKTKEHIKTPYKTTKSHSSRNKSKKNNNYEINISTKSSNYWKSLLYDAEEIINNNISQEIDIEIYHIYNSFILENPFVNKKEYKLLFCNPNEDIDEDLNKSF